MELLSEMSEASGLCQGYQQSSNNAPPSLSCSPQTPNLLPSNSMHSLQTVLHLILKNWKHVTNKPTAKQAPSSVAQTECGISILGRKLGCSLQQFWSSFLFLMRYESSFGRRLFMDTSQNPGVFWLYHNYDDYSVSGTHRQHHSRQWSHTYKLLAQRDYEPNNPHKHPRSITYPNVGAFLCSLVRASYSCWKGKARHLPAHFIHLTMQETLETSYLWRPCCVPRHWAWSITETLHQALMNLKHSNIFKAQSLFKASIESLIALSNALSQGCCVNCRNHSNS